MKKVRTLIAGHRGAKGLAPENTIEAFEKAVALGADMVEFDVRRTADGVLVVFHDEAVSPRSGRARGSDVRRTAERGLTPASAKKTREGDCPKRSEQSERSVWTVPEARRGIVESAPPPSRPRKIRQLSYKKLLAFASVRVPTFEQVLRTLTGRIKMDIEIKEEGFEREAVRMIRARAKINEVVVTSFIDSVIARVKKFDPAIRTGLLLGPESASGSPAALPVERLKRAKADFVAPHYSLLSPGFLSRARKEGYPVVVWTVNDAASIKRLIRARVAVVITDFPDFASHPKSSRK